MTLHDFAFPVAMPRGALLVLAAVALTGCSSVLNTAGSSHFSCKGDNCPTPFEVYDGSNGESQAVRMGRDRDSLKKDEHTPADTLREANVRMDLTAVRPASELLVQGAPGAKPLRQAAQVMRVWIAPWIDRNDNLNWPGYVYTDVTPKTWTFGEESIRHGAAAPPASFPLPSFATY